jgi:hypothetical protein
MTDAIEIKMKYPINKNNAVVGDPIVILTQSQYDDKLLRDTFISAGYKVEIDTPIKEK